MRIAFFGSANTIFTRSYMKLLEKNNHEVILFNNSIIKKPDDAVNYNASDLSCVEENKRNDKKVILKKYIKKLGADNSSLINYLVEHRDINHSMSEKNKTLIEKELNKFNADIIIFFWGTTLRPEIEFVDKISNAKKCLIINTYPTRQKFKSLKSNRFKKQDKNYFQYFDKIVFPSTYMLDEFLNHGYVDSKQDVLVNPDFIFQPNISIPRNNKNKKMIFLGNTDFAQRKIDDISSLLINIASNGILVFVQESHDTKMLKEHSNIHTFKPFSFDEILDGKLSEYISSFDGVLYAYNDVSVFRYNSSITTRLLLAENSNVPVYIYGAKPEYFNDLTLNIESYNFNDVSKLVELIENKKVCVNSVHRYHKRLDKLIGFISC